MNQPDLHHEGPLTIELVNGIMDKLKVAMDEITAYTPSDARLGDTDYEWENCKSNWTQTFQYAGIRCAAILTKLECDVEYRLEDDHKCIDIALCILRDFEAAKANGFEVGWIVE